MSIYYKSRPLTSRFEPRSLVVLAVVEEIIVMVVIVVLVMILAVQ